jgi:hypothetical protein
MAFIGNQPAESFTSFATQEFSTSATTSYTLDHAVTNENEIALFINNVRQQPGSGKAYTATGTALTLSAATASTDTMYCVFLGRALQTVNPAGGSIGSSQLSADAITGQTALTSAPADTDEFLISDAGVLKRIDVSLIGEKNTPYFEMRLGSDQTGISDNTSTKIQFDTSDLDSDSGVDVSTNHRYTVQSGGAGKYLLLATGRGDTASANDNRDVYVMIYKNGSAIARNEFGTSNTSDAQRIGKTVYTIEDLSEGDYIETYIHINSSANANTNIAKSFISRMSGFKITSS